MPPEDPAAEVEKLRQAVAKHFPVYDVSVSYQAVTMMITAPAGAVDAGFDALRRELKAMGFVPFIRYEGGEHKITIVRRPPARQANLWINRALLAATFATTTLAGMALWADYSRSAELLSLSNLLWGALFFAVPLMAILGVHELSHYYASKRNGVDASLPYFIPFLPPFGTMGAFISMRDPMPSRRALVEIGAAGPLGGLAVTLPVALLGLYLTSLGQPLDGPVGDEGLMAIVIQPLYQLLAMFIPLPEGVPLHPTAFAAWVGFFVTAINLLPAGQLDGGHVARGLLGDRAKYLSYAVGGLLVVLSFVAYSGWLLFGLLVVMLGLNHPAPLNDITPPGPRAKVIGAAVLVVFAATFVPTPMFAIQADHSFDMDAVGGANVTVPPGGVIEVRIVLTNAGNTDSVVQLTLNDVPGSWRGSIFLEDGANATNRLTVPLAYEGAANVTVRLAVDATPGARDLQLHAASEGAVRDLVLNVTVG